MTKILSFILGLEYELEAGRSVFFLMMIGHFEIVSPKISKSFMNFLSFKVTLILKGAIALCHLWPRNF